MLYFAYGSNLWPTRLIERVPGARVIGRARLRSWQLHFHKRSDVDGSGKAGISPADNSGAEVWGALYRLPPAGVPALDRVEGLGVGYDKHTVEVARDSGETASTFTYVPRPEVIDASLRPFAWYHRFVVAGAEHHRLPGDYVEALRSVASDPDPDADRRRFAEDVLSRRTPEIPGTFEPAGAIGAGR